MSSWLYRLNPGRKERAILVGSLRKKIFIGYGITLVLTILVFALALNYLFDLGQASHAILTENYKSILAAENMVYAIERQDSATLLLFLGYEDQGWKQFRENESLFFQWLARAKDNITVEGEEKVVSAIEKEYASYLRQIAQARPVYKSDLQKTATFYHETILPSFQSVREACIRLREINQEAMFRTSERAHRIAQRAVWSMVIIGSAAVILGLGFSLLLSNLFTRPVRQMMEATAKISEGNYEVMIPTYSSDELGQLTHQFNSMVKKLKSYHDLNIEQIMAEKGKSEAIIRSMDDGILVVDDKLLVTGINPTAAAALGIEPAQVKGKHFLEVVKDEGLFNHMKQTVETGQHSSTEEGRNLLTIEQNNKLKHYQWSMRPMLGKSGSLLGVVLLLRDVTRLTELNRLKSEFVMTASHELRTPLTSIGMSIKLLLEKAMGKLGEKEQQLLTAAHEDLQRLKALVNNLLDLSKIEAGKMALEFERVSLQTLSKNVVTLLKAQVDEKQVQLALELPQDLPSVRADATKVSWVLTNLISNALRYVEKEGHIRVSAEQLDPYVHISVSDDGAGIPYEEQSRIFDKFVQIKTDKALGGSGLGLTICKEIVRAHGGTLWVESTPGKGSTFTFTLPIEGKS